MTTSVMGATGSGKTSVRTVHIWPACKLIHDSQFINLASGSHLRVGVNLRSCTAEVQVADEFVIDGRRVILIDTPGFDDTHVSDAEILEKIAAFLAITWVLLFTASRVGSTFC